MYFLTMYLTFAFGETPIVISPLHQNNSFISDVNGQIRLGWGKSKSQILLLANNDSISMKLNDKFVCVANGRLVFCRNNEEMGKFSIKQKIIDERPIFRIQQAKNGRSSFWKMCLSAWSNNTLHFSKCDPIASMSFEFKDYVMGRNVSPSFLRSISQDSQTNHSKQPSRNDPDSPRDLDFNRYFNPTHNPQHDDGWRNLHAEDDPRFSQHPEYNIKVPKQNEHDYSSFDDPTGIRNQSNTSEDGIYEKLQPYVDSGFKETDNTPVRDFGETNNDLNQIDKLISTLSQATAQDRKDAALENSLVRQLLLNKLNLYMNLSKISPNDDSLDAGSLSQIANFKTLLNQQSERAPQISNNDFRPMLALNSTFQDPLDMNSDNQKPVSANNLSNKFSELLNKNASLNKSTLSNMPSNPLSVQMMSLLKILGIGSGLNDTARFHPLEETQNVTLISPPKDLNTNILHQFNHPNPLDSQKSSLSCFISQSCKPSNLICPKAVIPVIEKPTIAADNKILQLVQFLGLQKAQEKSSKFPIVNQVPNIQKYHPRSFVKECDSLKLQLPLPALEKQTDLSDFKKHENVAAQNTNNLLYLTVNDLCSPEKNTITPKNLTLQKQKEKKSEGTKSITINLKGSNSSNTLDLPSFSINLSSKPKTLPPKVTQLSSKSLVKSKKGANLAVRNRKNGTNVIGVDLKDVHEDSQPILA